MIQRIIGIVDVAGDIAVDLVRGHIGQPPGQGDPAALVIDEIIGVHGQGHGVQPHLLDAFHTPVLELENSINRVDALGHDLRHGTVPERPPLVLQVRVHVRERGDVELVLRQRDRPARPDIPEPDFK